MLYKESAIAVMVAVMLGAASIFGGFSLIPALAAEPIASETVSQGSTESIIVDAIEITAEKSTSRADGTVTVKIVQGNSTLRSGTLDTEFVKQNLVPVEVDLNNINVTGSFEILVEYQGSGSVTVSDIDVIEGTETAGGPDDTNNEPDAPPQDNEPNDSDEELENVVARETISPDDGSMIVDTVEFSAKKSTSRADGTLTIAIVQDDEILDTDDISTSVIKQAYNAHEASFTDLEVTGDFEVVFMYQGSGSVGVASINVPGGTVPAGDDDNDATGTIQLTVNSVNEDNQAITGLWVTVTNGMTSQAEWTPETFTLEAGGTYTVTMDDFYDSDSGTMYTFVKWADSEQDNSRTATLNDDETFTAVYNVVGDAPPPAEDPPAGDPSGSPPPSSGAGSIAAYAYRIPSSHWGPTFVSADAQMYFVLYNSTGHMIYGGFFDENGNTVTGLIDGEQYWIMPTDCHHCHGGTHDVVFDHYEDGSTERVRAITTGASVGAYYEYVPDTP